MTELVDAIGEFYGDPLGFVLFTFDWKDEEGPDEWQINILSLIGEGVLTTEEAIQIAVASGHGIGKTALVAWIILWFISTRPHPQVIVTANTETQLNTKTWRELAKWHKRSINKDWFEWTATRFYHKQHRDTWFASAIPWSVNRSEAFAGAHEENVLVVFDEASAIDDIIWETAEGAMTTPGAMWLAFGNPTKNTGRFKECFGRFKHRWQTRQIDSRSAKMADINQINKWIDDYGEDSDFVKVRVRGVFPAAGSNQFIGSDIVDACRTYKAAGYESLPKVLGVDVARFGDDQTVFTIRQGRKVWPQERFRKNDTMWIADKVYELNYRNNFDAIFIDGVGVGGGVVDRLRQLGLDSIIDVNAGGKAHDDAKYFNKRAEMWGRLRDYIKDGAEIPDDNELAYDISAPEYGFTGKQQIQLEKKEDMKKRGLASPDNGDSLALTFAENVFKRSEYENDFGWTDDTRSRIGGY